MQPEANEKGFLCQQFTASNFYIHMQCFQKLSFKIDHEVQHLLKSLEKK